MLDKEIRNLTSESENHLRRRLVVIAIISLLNSTFVMGMETVILPLWATKELGLSPGDWANLRSLRWTGALVGVIILSALSDHFGQRLIAIFCMISAALSVSAAALNPKASLWFIMPALGAAISTAFVNLNVITQQISTSRQGLANAVYRSMGAAAAIAAPIIATALAAHFHSYKPVIFLFSGLLLIAAFVLLFYKSEVIPTSIENFGAEMLRLWSGYKTALKEKQLMRFIHISLIWSSALAGVGAFAAIRFTRELNQTDSYFGTISAISGTLAFAVSAVMTGFLDRISLRKFCTFVAVLSGICSILMGLGNSTILTTFGFIALGPLTFAFVAPMSMWVSRAAGKSTQGAAFSVHKVIGAVYIAVSMAILGFLEKKIGMQVIFLYGGALSAITGLAFLTLHEPKIQP